jgi:outer membrane receptor protein involved in Fe transport
MTIYLRALRAACLAGAAIGSGVAAQPAAQQEAAADYDLPAQDLGETLRAIARTSGRDVIFPAEAVAGRRAPPLRGRLTLGQAVRTVLDGSGLEATFRAGAVLIRERPPSPEGVASPEDITVTGTRIRGAGSPSPVITTTRRELEEAGVTDLTGFARILPQNFTGGQNPGIAGGGQQGGQNNVNNSTTLNLRGLGPDATLTLLNGHRLAYDALNQGVDISVIPLAAIERIEVIADGASALYGSDAVGGVANIILRPDFDGGQVWARAGASTSGGNSQRQFGALAGGRWTSGGFMTAIDFLHTTPILAGQRDYASTLDEGATLISGLSQLSIVVAGHQQVTGGISLEVDGQFSHRRSRKSTPFFTTSDVFTNGLRNRPEVDSFSVTPTLRLELPWGWEARASASRGISRTEIFSRRFLGGVQSPSYLIYENRFRSFEATAEGPLLDLPGGPARLAVGAGLRSVLLDVNVSQVLPGLRRTTRDFTEARDISFAYAELSAPLVGPENDIPLVERLRLSAALRYESYEGIDDVATPKLGLVYQPHPAVTIRAAWGRSFKVPTLNQVNQVRAGNLVAASLFTPQPVPPLPAGATVLLLSGGNPDLRAERARTWSAGIELRPRFAEGLRLEANWFDIDYAGRVSSPFSGTLAALANPAFRDFVQFNPSPADVQALVATLPLGLVNQSGQPFDPNRVAAVVDATLQNIARERVRGLDLAGSYAFALGGGTADLNAAATYLDGERQISSGQPVLQRAGIIFNPPHWRWRLGGGWSRGAVGITTTLSYVGGTLDDRFTDLQRTDDFLTLDASVRIGSIAARGPLAGVELRLTGLNLLNAAPAPVRDPDPAAPPYDSINQSPVGRFVSLSVTKRW